jgi:flagellar basal body-associated protein FliL
MHREGEEVHITTEEARSGRRGNHVITVLIVSLLLACAAMTIAWVTGALTTTDGTRQPAPSDAATGTM